MQTCWITFIQTYVQHNRFAWLSVIYSVEFVVSTCIELKLEKSHTFCRFSYIQKIQHDLDIEFEFELAVINCSLNISFKITKSHVLLFQENSPASHLNA